MKTILLLCTAVVCTAACTNTTSQTANVQNINITKLEPAKAAPAETPVDNAPRITLADAKKDYDAGNAVIIDVRDEAAFKLEHITGALNITPQTLDANIGKLPKGKKLIVYCSWPSEHSSASLVTQLKAKGIENAYALVGGTKAWKDAGYPMEAGK